GKDVFQHLFSLNGKVYKEKQGRKTLRFVLDGKHYFAKLHRGVGWEEIVKHLLQWRLPVLGAQNEWRAIQRLEQVGIHTMPLVGYGKKGWNPARLKSFVITEALDDTISLENLCRRWLKKPPSYALKRALIREVATMARTLHDHGMNHRDFYLCHFLLDVSQGEENIDPRRLKLYLIDLHRVQIRRHIPWRWRVKDIAGLYFSSMDAGLTQRDLLRFVRAYWNKPLPKAVTENKPFWSHVEKRAISLYRKIHKKDPTGPL
ncbi:MAG: lipopolysaccharide core heptose(I) kinase RfaP, partial [Thermodesulfobacteriota bacterium]|nr:lipopolysaccharide core heptose(I) kinase RfaP [Thermodesulfobacteriota bacterium]